MENKKVVRKLNKKKVSIAVVGFIIVIILVCISILGFNLCPIDKDAKSKKFTIEAGTPAYTVVDNLEKEGFIRNSTAFKVYMKLFGTLEFAAGNFFVSPADNSIEIYNNFKNNKFNVPEAELITFKEGLGIKAVAQIMSEHTKLTEKEIMTKLDDEAYIDTLIKKYWFITDEVKNKDIYHPLEGYLFPDTYSLEKDASVESIVTMMLDRMDKELTTYKKDIEASKYSVHEYLTLASVVELEGSREADRQIIAGVFYNRLNSNMDLGSCVTTYYAVGKIMGQDELYNRDITKVNPYNTRASGMIGKLPVGPIANPGSVSIKVVIEPKKTDYYYFCSDTDGKLYFTKTVDEHNATVSKLTKEGKF